MVCQRWPTPVLELTWEGQRVGTRWMVFGGKSGISSVAVELWEGAGVDGGDMTDESFDEVVDALS